MSPERMPILTADGLAWVEVTSPADRSAVGSYWNAVHRFRDTGDERDLDQFSGAQVAGQRLQTDPDEIEFWAYQGELDFEDIYEPDGP